MTGDITLSSKGKTGKNIVTEEAEDDIDELNSSDFSKSAAILFDEIYNGEASVLPSSNFVDLVETLGKVFHCEELAGKLHKVDPNKRGILYRFAFVRWYVDLVEYPDQDKL